MSEIAGANGNHEKSMEEGVVGNSKEGSEDVRMGNGDSSTADLKRNRGTSFPLSISFMQKLIAEVIGTYFVIFAGCASVVVNLSKGSVTFPGICIVWGLVVMVMVYSVGHISGAHFNPAVTIAFATCRRFPWKQVPAYISAQVLGSTLASGTLRLLFGGKREHFPGTIPAGSDLQSLVLEFIISFYLMFVISGVATDNRAAYFRGIHEPCKELGSSDRSQPL
ncbi:aquaporin NIP1-1-like isoform X2 [Magnolia sinica]|uniref:aquaporin NIP1-1-like isoform X2 n=1 Tax=Magnolia sinica TaxID=86752 RepID=UPI0026580F2D|nr:aquaporin NIP1-1-like isoform X2 [Magnolia sinica]